MKKLVNINGEDYWIRVNLNTLSEKCLNGKRWHTVRIESLRYSDQFYQKDKVETHELEETIGDLIRMVRDDNYSKYSEEEKLLINLGFKK